MIVFPVVVAQGQAVGLRAIVALVVVAVATNALAAASTRRIAHPRTRATVQSFCVRRGFVRNLSSALYGNIIGMSENELEADQRRRFFCVHLRLSASHLEVTE